MAELNQQRGAETVPSQAFEHTSRCWYCGEIVRDPKLRVEEGIYSYGTYIGFRFTGVIHESCAEKAKKEYEGYMWRVVEGACQCEPLYREYAKKVHEATGGQARYCYNQQCLNPCYLQYHEETG